MTKVAVIVAASLVGVAGAANAAPPSVATYTFQSTLNSSVAGAPALVATDPLGTSSFVTDTVFGNPTTVYSVGGANLPVLNQGGLTLNTTGLITDPSVYSVEMVFKFTARDGAWRRIFDVQERQSDNGFYVDPANNLAVFPIAGGAPFTNNVYHDVFISVGSGSTTFYLDGSAQATASTHIMDLPADGMVNFFLDNVVGGGQGEWSPADISLIRFYNAALTAVPPPPPPPIPEPETYALMLAGLGVLGFVARRRKA